MTAQAYDYIIAGAGLSGLSLACRMVEAPEFAHKKILLIDQELAPQNDKTWSFWYEGSPPFESLIYKSWNQIQVVFKERAIVQQLQKYTYHSIQSGVFRKAALQKIRAHKNVDIVECAIGSMQGFKDKAVLKTSGQSYSAPYIFQSAFTPPGIKRDRPHYPLIQHFLGWEIETTEPIFDASTVTLMDFDPNFSGGIAFIYILPQTSQKALIEYTLFSNQVKPKAFYEEKLNIYLHNKFKLSRLNYKIRRTEYGEIPMQDHIYAPWYAPRILNMGTVGGLTKPSTGYTFARIQQHIGAIVEELKKDNPPALPPQSPYRYRAYDLWLLQIMHDHPQKALTIFEQLFSHNPMDEVFHFLAEENSLLQDFKTMSKVSYVPFFKAMWKTKKRLLEI